MLRPTRRERGKRYWQIGPVDLAGIYFEYCHRVLWFIEWTDDHGKYWAVNIGRGSALEKLEKLVEQKEKIDAIARQAV